MYNFVCIGLFILLHIVDVSVQAVSCPTSRNKPVNITRVTDGLGAIWVKNGNTGKPVANAIYNSTTGGCSRPSYTTGYTIYCEKLNNSNNTLYTLEVHQPTEGDVYYISGDQNTTTTIVFPDCSSLSPEAKIGIGVAVALVVVGFVILVLGVCFYIRRKQRNKGKESKQDGATNSKTETSPHRGGIIIDENVEYVSQGGIFSDTVQYAVVNKKPETGRKKDEIIIDENVEYVGLGDVASPPVVPRRGYQESKPSKRGEEGLKYVDVDFSNQKPATGIRGANRQSTVQYSQIQPKHLQH